MSNSRSFAYGSRCYEQLKVVDDTNNSRSNELRPLDGMNNSGVWMIWTILDCETMALKCCEQLKLVIDMNDSGS